MRLRRWSKWLVYDAAFVLAALLLSAVSVPQISNIPPNVANVQDFSCSVKSTFVEVLDAKTQRVSEMMTVDAIGTGSYIDPKEKPFRILVSTRRVEITAENVEEETKVAASRDCVRWVTTVKRLVSESSGSGKDVRRKK